MRRGAEAVLALVQAVGMLYPPRRGAIMKRVILFAACAAAVLVSCGTPTTPTTIDWAADGTGFIQYSTNDTGFLNMAFVKLYPDTAETPMTTVTVSCKKISGAATTGYGVVFCAQDASNYYRVMIHTNGRYRVMKTIGGVDQLGTDWTDTSYLATGYDAVNQISITKASGSNFQISFNGTQVYTYTDPAASFSGGQAGFFVYIGDGQTEYLAYNPVDVRFQMTAPVVIPTP